MSETRLRDKPYSQWTEIEQLARVIVTTCGVYKADDAEEFAANKINAALAAAQQRIATLEREQIAADQPWIEAVLSAVGSVAVASSIFESVKAARAARQPATQETPCSPPQTSTH